MKKTFLITCCTVFSLLLVCNIVLFSVKSSQTKQTLDELSNDAKYFVTDFNNYITVYHYGTDNVYKVLERPLVNELPMHDILLLENGIAVKDLSDLEQLIEDYDG